jgi:ATP-dependent DNA ligase
MPMKIRATLAQIARKLTVKWGAQNAYGIVRHSTLWLKPQLIGQFEFVEWTEDAHLRHSRFIALRDDKKAKDVKRER